MSHHGVRDGVSSFGAMSNNSRVGGNSMRRGCPSTRMGDATKRTPSASTTLWSARAAEAKVPLNHIRNGNMNDDDWAKLARKMGEVSSAPMFIDDSPNMTMMEIRAKARRLKQRHDLIPNLVETVKGIALQEQTVFGDIAKARSALLSAGNPQEKIAANGQLDGALGRLLLIVENYPQLKSNENFLRLQDELAGTENRIAVERKRYNDTLQDYNTYIKMFPHNIFAGWAGFKPNDAYFTASEGSRQVPKVNFSSPSKSAPQANPQPAPAR